MFDGFSYSSSEINYWTESCIVSGLMTRVAYKSSGRLTPFQDGGNETDECKKKKNTLTEKCFFSLLLHSLITLRCRKVFRSRTASCKGRSSEHDAPHSPSGWRVASRHPPFETEVWFWEEALTSQRRANGRFVEWAVFECCILIW